MKEQEKYQKKLKKKIPKKQLEPFTVAATFSKARVFTEGEVYLSWTAMENYLNQVLDSIMPANLAAKNIQAYVGRSSDINAFCLYDGTMIVNAGLLAEIKSEAALAAVMAHELSHFIKNHALAQFKKRKKPKKITEKNWLKETITTSGFSQENELEADKLGFDIVRNAGYDVAEAGTTFELIAREAEYRGKRLKSSLANTDTLTINTRIGKVKVNTLEKMMNSHPDLKERKESLDLYIKSNPQTKKQKFKMDEDLFKALQNQARLESVSLVFDRNNYRECLERAFTYHLFHPAELTYSYYTAESVRRLCLLDFRLRKKGFLAETLTNEGFKEGEGILHDLRYLVPNQETYQRIKATELLSKSPGFETYREAFEFFTKKLEARNYGEVHLMRALFENNPGKRKTNVDKYLALASAEHKEYAKHYLNNTLTEAVSQHTGEIVMIPQINFLSIDNLGKNGFYFKKTEIAGKEMANLFATGFANKFSDTKTISMPLAATQNFNTLYKYQNVINTSLYGKRDENEGYEVVHYYKELEDEDYVGKTDIFRLSPDLWEFFNSNRIKAITLAAYTRYTNRSTQKLKVFYLFMGPPGWITSLSLTANYKQLTMLSYDSKLGTVYLSEDFRRYKLRSANAVRMFRKLREQREDDIKEYLEKF